MMIKWRVFCSFAPSPLSKIVACVQSPPRLFTGPYFSVRGRAAIVAFRLGPLMRAKLGRVQIARGYGWWSARRAEKKTRETVTASLSLLFKGRGRFLAPVLIKSINNPLPSRKNLSNQGNYMIAITCCCAVENF